MSLADLKVGDAVCYGDLEGTVERILKNGFIAIGGTRFTRYGEKYGSASDHWNRTRLEVLTPELKASREEQRRFDKASLSFSQSVETLERIHRHIRNVRPHNRRQADVERLERIAAALEAIVREEDTNNGCRS